MKLLNYKLIKLFNNLIFFAPIAILIRTSKGISYSEFLLLQAILSISILFFEIPTGYITDKIGYKNSIIISQIMLFISRILLYLANSFYIFLFEVIVEAISFSFISGTNEAYLYEICNEYKIEYIIESSKINSFGTIGFILSILMFPLFYKLNDLNFLILLTALSTFIGLLLTFSIKNIKHSYKIKNKINFDLLLNKNFFNIILINSTIGFVLLIINFFYVEILIRENIEIQLITIIILTYSLLTLLVPFILNNKKEFMYSFFSLLSFICLLSFIFIKNQYVIIPMILLPFFIEILSNIIYEINNKFIDNIKSNENRATILSIINMGNNILEVVFLLFASFFIFDNLNYLFLFACILLLLNSFIGKRFINQTKKIRN
ncbi:MAG: MFS transporter [Erysipelotrichaceae bacterium]|nr:MFS transporter [Erysipelotrichaceae bacterium]